MREKDKCNLVLLCVKLGFFFVCYCCLISFLKLQEYQNCCLESKAVAILEVKACFSVPAKKARSELQDMLFSLLLLKQHSLLPELPANSAGQQKQRVKDESEAEQKEKTKCKDD